MHPFSTQCRHTERKMSRTLGTCRTIAKRSNDVPKIEQNKDGTQYVLEEIMTENCPIWQKA